MSSYSANNLSMTANETSGTGDTRQIAIPLVMFLLGVVSNGLAIISLLRCKYKNNNCSHKAQSNAHVREGCNSTTDGLSTFVERRMTCEGISYTSKKRSSRVKFGAFQTLVSILAILDLFSTVCTSPLTITLYINGLHIEEYGGKTLCNYSAFVMLFFGFASMAMVMTMSVERLLSIRFAFLYHQKATGKKALYIAFAMFIISAVLCAMPTVGFGSIRAMYPYTWCFANWNANLPKDKAFIYLYVALGIIMLVITLTCNGIVIVGLLKMRLKLRAICSSKKRKRISIETQMLIQLVTITTIFVICWSPFLFRMLVNQLDYLKNPEGDRISLWLVAVNPILDPWVYILCRKTIFRQIYRRVKAFGCIKTRQSITPENKSEESRSIQNSSPLQRKQYMKDNRDI